MSSLSGIRIIEFCEIAAGPYCGMLLADMGADVIKVERASGDAMRTWPPVNDGYSENFASINRGKRSVVLDLKSPEGVANARRLILSADAVIENFRPGVMKRNGLDYQSLSAEKPDLIYCSISAFGQSGPRTSEGGFDLTMQAMSGVMSITGEPGSAPVKCGVPLCDFVSGLYGAMGVVSALVQKNNTGKGQHIDVSMLGATLGVAALQTSEYFGTGKAPQKLGSAHPRNAPYQAFKAKDDYFGMAAGNNSLWHHVCDVVGKPDLKDVERFSTPTLRAANQVELKGMLEEVFATQPVSHWLDAFAEKGVPCSPINSFADALKDKQVEHMGWVQPITLPNGVETQTFGPVLRINDECQPIPSGPPALGEHTEAVLASLAGDAVKA
ncbi:CaiB/BaiF CoA transferase family protein [Cognatishimia activa]|uniref:Succinyl-CoA:(R)-benzylsuccinate CoA-transferase subunit BbsF n=1 Tax=Cognatishimia activa TaxID=1715691 RepID=A0A0P1IQZ3_9RHOB|nr:CoA transferase [Cognatishimia activa]CUI27111.1 Succinyl-CoA:(R)-benzylsuccinate CoA-transferase subunit BbsF [Cognatishimia activa]CUK24227.1 Succinyl-CoA:(R)-benzylsuccinate CoA-transferase subunit BbsF [Cognatishimia activa]